MSRFRKDDLVRLRSRIQRDPKWFKSAILGQDSWSLQDRIIESVRDNEITAVPACHGPGKTREAARVALWFLLGFPQSKVITSAPTWRQVEKLLWAEIRHCIKSSKYDLGLKLPPKAPEAYVDDNWYAIGLSTNEGERIQGFHARHILVIIDEASGVDDEIYDAVEGLLSSGVTVRLLLLSNTTRAEGFFYQLCTTPVAANVIKIGVFDTPNFAGIKDAYFAAATKEERIEVLLSVKELVHDYLVNPAWAARLIRHYGEDSQIFRIRALAEFPTEEPDQLFPLWMVERSQHLWEKLVAKHWWAGSGSMMARKQGFGGPIDLGCDIARYGNSESGIAPIANGICAPLLTWTKASAPETAGRIYTFAQRLRAHRVRIDDDGVGGPVLDNCVKAGLQGIVRFLGGQPAKQKRRYLNARCESYFELQEALQAEELALPPDPKLLGQLTILRYWLNDDGQLCVTTKEQLREEGKVSPDRADMVMMGNARSVGITVTSKPSGW